MIQSSTSKKRILYFELTSGIGGSIINVLYPVVTNLDRDRYEPLVLFYWPNPYRERFQAAGIETLVFEKPCSKQHPGAIAGVTRSRVIKNIKKDGGRAKALYHALGSYIRLSYCLPQILRLARLLKDRKIDLVQINGASVGPGREIILAAKLAGVPTLCYVQGFNEFQAVDRQIARLVSQFVFCSNAIGAHCTTNGLVNPEGTLTIYPGVVEVEKWVRSCDGDQLRQEFGWTAQDFVVGNVGRLVGWKGQDVFIKAIAEVKKEIPNVRGLLVGEPDRGEEGPNGEPSPFYQHLLHLVQSLGLAENIHFAGFRSDIPEVLAAVDVLVHSSTEPEPFATAVIEGMMSGSPVIAARAGGMPEMIQDQVTGLLTRPGDPQAMADAILFYHRDRDRARNIARAGQQRAIADLTAERHIREFYELYEALFA
ncbi:MAG: glycosyltransferase family 4 protein [Chloroflexota bacterium]